MKNGIKCFALVFCLAYVNICFSQETSNDLIEALSDMRKETSVNSVIYTDKTSTSNISSNAFYLYILKRNNQIPVLKLRIQYYGATRLDVYEYILKNNENILRLQSDFISKNYDDYWNYNSWCDIDVTPSVLEFVRSLSVTSTPKLKYIGSYNNKERKLTLAEVQAVVNIIRLYDILLEE